MVQWHSFGSLPRSCFVVIATHWVQSDCFGTSSSATHQLGACMWSFGDISLYHMRLSNFML
jgi:hypothetical protein